jgi:hypothetical protein
MLAYQIRGEPVGYVVHHAHPALTGWGGAETFVVRLDVFGGENPAEGAHKHLQY